MGEYKPEERRGMLILTEELKKLKKLPVSDFSDVMRALVDYVLGYDVDESKLSVAAAIVYEYTRDHVDRMETKYRQKKKAGESSYKDKTSDGSKNGAETEQNGAEAEQNGANVGPNTNTELPILNTNTELPILTPNKSIPLSGNVFVDSVVWEYFEKWLDTMEGIGYTVSDEIKKKQIDKLCSLSNGDPETAAQILKTAIEGKYKGFFRVGKTNKKESGFDWGISEQKEGKER